MGENFPYGESPPFLLEEIMREFQIGFNPSQLLLPLYVPLDIIVPEELSANKSQDEEEVFYWSEQAIKDLHIGILENALNNLKNPRVSVKVKREILEWINVPTVPFRYAYKYAFSFQLCCQVAGLDHEQMQTCLEERSKYILT
jgi:hypothetical protein